jgi:hypothetical protein
MDHVLRNTTEPTTRLQVGVCFVRTDIKQSVGAGNSNDELIDLQSTGIGNAVYSVHLLIGSIYVLNMM